MEILNFIYNLQNSINNLAYSVDTTITYIVIGIVLTVLTIFAIITLVNHLNNETENDMDAVLQNNDEEDELMEKFRIKYD